MEFRSFYKNSLVPLLRRGTSPDDDGIIAIHQYVNIIDKLKYGKSIGTSTFHEIRRNYLEKEN